MRYNTIVNIPCFEVTTSEVYEPCTFIILLVGRWIHLIIQPVLLPYFAYNLFSWVVFMSACIDDIYLVTRRQSKKRFRSRIYNAWGGKCAYCGEVAKSLDHVIPRHKGGLTVIENLVPACLSCNGHKGAEDWVAWYRKQEFYNIERETMIWFWITQDTSAVDNSMLTGEILGLFFPVEQFDFLSSFNVVDNTTFNDRALHRRLGDVHS
jgi:hypothetical protein